MKTGAKINRASGLIQQKVYHLEIIFILESVLETQCTKTSPINLDFKVPMQ